MFNKEFQRRQIEFYAMITVGVAEIARDIGQFLVPMPEVLTEHAGDFALGYMVNWFSNTTMELVPALKKIPELPEQKRLKISAGLALATVFTLELLPLIGSEIADIPAGVLGVLANYGVRRLAQRWVGEQVDRD